MSIQATVVEDTIYKNNRLVTWRCRYPRIIHAEMMTHRVFSRNLSSSRAIPVQRLIQSVMEDPFIPEHWGKDQKGMQAFEELDNPVGVSFYPGTSYEKKIFLSREAAWLFGRDNAVNLALAYSEAGYHKQVVNRLLEPFQYAHGIYTANQLENFFNLRVHADAEPHIQALASAMKGAMDASTPREIVERNGESVEGWHLPLLFPQERKEGELSDLLVLSAARCAAVSYQTVEGTPMTAERANAVYAKLVGSKPLHASPFEHQARPITEDDSFPPNNFPGWVQQRSIIEYGKGA